MVLVLNDGQLRNQVTSGLFLFAFRRKHYLCISAPAIPLPPQPPTPGPGQYDLVDYMGPGKEYSSSSVFKSTTNRWTFKKSNNGPGPGLNLGLLFYLVFLLIFNFSNFNFVFIDYRLLIKYLVIFRWHQITKTLPQIRYLEVPTPSILRPPAKYILRHVPTPRILKPPPR